MQGRCAASLAMLARRFCLHALHPRSQQASPDARVATVVDNWCLWSSRIKRAARGRTSLPHATPLLLGGVARDLWPGRSSDDGYQRQFGRRLMALSSQRLTSGVETAGHPALPSGKPDEAVQGLQRQASRAKLSRQGWQTPLIAGWVLNSQPANPSVKGTCLRQAPYVER